MNEPRIGRVLVASLHQAIADVLPSRLEFYENWLSVSGLREGTIGLAPLFAVLSFLRTEGAAYDADHRAGRRICRGLDRQRPRAARAAVHPRASDGVRTRAALRTARSLVRADVSGIAGDRETAARDGIDRSARIALL